jgi:hypothetical protein
MPNAAIGHDPELFWLSSYIIIPAFQRDIPVSSSGRTEAIYILTHRYTGDSNYAPGLSICVSPLRSKKRKPEKKYNNRHFDAKLAPEYFDAELTICIAFPDKRGEGSMQETSFKMWLQIGC